MVFYWCWCWRCGKNWRRCTTAKKIKVIKGHIIDFENFSKQKALIKNVGLDYKKELENYLLSKKYAVNSVSKYTKFIKTICLHARIKGVKTHNELDLIKSKYHKVDKIYLDLNELKQIENTDFKQDYLTNAKDWLLISCETGQRISDFMRFKKEMIRVEAGKKLIEFTQQKTRKIMTIPMSKKVVEILEKRGGDFPRQTTQQRYNDYIKEVCQLAKINQKVKGSLTVTDKEKKITRKVPGVYEKWELISSHVGRRSFATNNYGRVPTSLLISATGHSTEKMFLEYIGKSDTQKALALAEYF